MTIDRSIKGGRAFFFDDSATDKLLSMLLQLTSEHWVLKERVLSLEALIADKGVVSAQEIESFEPSAEQTQAWEKLRQELIRSVMGPIEDAD